MKKDRMSKKFIFIALLTILILQLIALWPSLHLSLFGDDWLAFWRAWIHSDPNLPDYSSPLKTFLTPYGPQDMNMGLLKQYFGFSALPYYITSFFWRLSVAYALFFVVLKLFRNKLAAVFSGAFFAVSAIGLDATNWVFNMTSYAGLLFLTIFVFFYFSSRQGKNYKFSLLAFISLCFAIIIVPIRMHGALILIFFSEALWFILDRTKSNLKYTAFRIALLLLTLLIIKIIGTSFADPNETISRTKAGVTLAADYINKGHWWILLTLVMSFGNMIFPDALWSRLGFGEDPFFPLSFLIFSIFILMLFILTPKQNRTNFYIYKLAIIGFIFNFVAWLMLKSDIKIFSSSAAVGSVLIGGYVSMLLMNLIISRYLEKKYQVFSSAIVFWPYAFLILPWITLNTGTIFPTVHRYMIASSLGVSLIWALLALLKINKKILIFAFVVSIIIQIYASYSYLNLLVAVRGREISEKIWRVLEAQLPHFDTKKVYVVLFASEPGSSGIAYYNAFFGFPPRMSLRDKIAVYRAPIAVTDYEGVVSAVTDGKTLKTSGYVEKPIPPDQVLAFLITGQTLDQIKVQNITNQVQQDLEKRSAEYLKLHPEVTYQE